MQQEQHLLLIFTHSTFAYVKEHEIKTNPEIYSTHAVQSVYFPQNGVRRWHSG